MVVFQDQLRHGKIARYVASILSSNERRSLSPGSAKAAPHVRKALPQSRVIRLGSGRIAGIAMRDTLEEERPALAPPGIGKLTCKFLRHPVVRVEGPATADLVVQAAQSDAACARLGKQEGDERRYFLIMIPLPANRGRNHLCDAGSPTAAVARFRRVIMAGFKETALK